MSRVRSVSNLFVSSVQRGGSAVRSSAAPSIGSMVQVQCRRWASTEADNLFGNRHHPHGLKKFDVAFVGSGSSLSKLRSPASTIFSFSRSCWLFEVGDGTARQITFGEYSYADISKIFISKMGCNNVFGLPILLVYCCSGNVGTIDEPLNIYGPPGIYAYICSALSAAHFKPNREIIVNELSMEARDMEKLDKSAFPWVGDKRTYLSSNFDPMPVHNITLKRVFSSPDNKGFWKLAENPVLSVVAGLVGSNQPSFGFVVKEVAKMGNLEKRKVPNTLTVEQLASLKRGKPVTLGDGTVLTTEDVLGSSNVPGRKVCIISTGRESAALTEAAKDCDVLIHEVAYNDAKVSIAKEKGGSNTDLAVTAAKNFNAKRLVISSIGNQFFPTRLSNPSIGEGVLLHEAQNAFERPNHISMAFDFMKLSIPLGGFDMNLESTLNPYIRSFKK